MKTPQEHLDSLLEKIANEDARVEDLLHKISEESSRALRLAAETGGTTFSQVSALQFHGGKSVTLLEMLTKELAGCMARVADLQSDYDVLAERERQHEVSLLFRKIA